ncbi:MAG: hypothetical protein VB062_08845 [Christensenella sp.]|nr:hypothetical protein [Christensenella sp.]
METIHMDPIPEIYCALAVIVPASALAPGFEDQLDQLIGHPVVPSKSFDDELSYTLVKTGNIPSWELNEVLKQMFGMLDGKLEGLKNLIRTYGYSFYVDIAFYQHGTYPALYFTGEAMKNIILLEADIGIDPY